MGKPLTAEESSLVAQLVNFHQFTEVWPELIQGNPLHYTSDTHTRAQREHLNLYSVSTYDSVFEGGFGEALALAILAVNSQGTPSFVVPSKIGMRPRTRVMVEDGGFQPGVILKVHSTEGIEGEAVEAYTVLFQRHEHKHAASDVWGLPEFTEFMNTTLKFPNPDPEPATSNPKKHSNVQA